MNHCALAKLAYDAYCSTLPDMPAFESLDAPIQLCWSNAAHAVKAKFDEETLFQRYPL